MRISVDRISANDQSRDLMLAKLNGWQERVCEGGLCGSFRQDHGSRGQTSRFLKELPSARDYCGGWRGPRRIARLHSSQTATRPGQIQTERTAIHRRNSTGYLEILS